MLSPQAAMSLIIYRKQHHKETPDIAFEHWHSLQPNNLSAQDIEEAMLIINTTTSINLYNYSEANYGII